MASMTALHVFLALVCLSLVSCTAIRQSHVEERAPSCPSVWQTVAADLKPAFNGCSRQAAFAIRFAFHDSGAFSSKTPFYAPAAGGADGSLLLSSSEINRPAEAPMQGYRQFLLGKYQTYKNDGVSAADLVQFAGNLAIKQCGGPTVQTVAGRKDNSQAAPDGFLPAAFGRGSDYSTLTQLFADKGFSHGDLIALIGAHTVSRSFAQRANGVPPGGAQDLTPTIWNNGFYNDTLTRTRGVFSFQSDVNLSKGPDTATLFHQFAADQSLWDSAFTSAMFRLSVLGIPQGTVSTFVDCTAFVA
ncbi:class II peroxidase [Polychaeton citri CBS 116435]|uniref:Peroxidase n=1 Tax=Polychaeton citri CBS 116435 TaxID=1314669 RepID=A0A9P4UT24_9PEZI|nr:class II peroxidase [Polychaeton citri CBS 116435]